jgi:glutathionylspermidine synthase
VRRHDIQPRPDHEQLLRAQGLEDTGHWDESACYELDLAEVGLITRATEELYTMCVAAAHFVVRKGRCAELGMPDWAGDGIVQSLERQPPSLLGRFDLQYAGDDDIKLLGYQAEDPSGLLETASAQWFWVEQVRPGDEQCNNLHRRLVESWHTAARKLSSDLVHLAWSTPADRPTVEYLAETAQQAGLYTHLVQMTDIGWNGKRFLDGDGAPIDTCLKLYPWEWMLGEPYGRIALDNQDTTAWIEPAWKAMLSNPGLHAVLWELYPDHPYLLPAYPGQRRSVPPPPQFGGRRLMLSSWVATAGGGRGAAAGAVMVEFDGDQTRLVPHFVPKSVRHTP